MRAQILDAKALRAISLAAFARGEGWSKTEVYGAHADVYAGDARPEILLLRTDRLADYASVVSRLIGVFAKVMERDEPEAYQDLVTADRYVFLGLASRGDDDGSVPLDTGVVIVAQARDMLLAAACAARI